jgi:uncharacterized caspase-like protein
MEQVSWRIGDTNEVISLDAFFNDFFYPGLVTEIAEGAPPKASLDIAAALQLPGLRVMLQQGLARVETRDGKRLLCFGERPTSRPQVQSEGQALALDPGDWIFFKDDPTCPWRVELEGRGQIEVANPDGDKGIELPKLTFDGQKSETRQSTLHVLSVGIDKYTLASSGFAPLASSVSSAKAVEGFFKTQAGQTPALFRDVHVWGGLYDHDATREAIRRRFGEMAGEVREDDVVLIFLSGHGVVPAGQEMFYFAPFDIRGPDPRMVRRTGLNTAMLAEVIREMRARRVVLIIDACQSGGAAESLAKIGQVKVRAEGSVGEIGVYLIAAVTPLQDAVQPTQAGNGALVVTLLEALKGSASGGEETLWVGELVEYVRRRLPDVSEAMGQRQTPLTLKIGLDFPIAKRQQTAALVNYLILEKLP